MKCYAKQSVGNHVFYRQILSAENPVFENKLYNRPNNEIVVIHFANKSLGLGWSSRQSVKAGWQNY
jgi:hypothetical protein